MIVAEGYMDVIALDRGDRQCGTTGTALTEEQIEALWKLVDEPLLCFDGDNAGRRAADGRSRASVVEARQVAAYCLHAARRRPGQYVGGSSGHGPPQRA